MTYKTTKVNYEVEMTFSNPLYASVMKYFFNNLVTNINDAFQNECVKNYQDTLNEFMEREHENAKSLGERL